MMKYLWGLLFGLGFAGPYLACAQYLNVVMATDRNYVIPTAVAMKSLIEAEKGSGLDLRFVIFVDKFSSGEIGRWTPSHEALLTQMCTANPGHVEVCFVDITDIEDAFLEKATRRYDNNKLIALRLVFPKIWANRDLPEFDSCPWLEKIREFLWLDSDVLVMKPLRPLLDEVGYGAEDRIHQPIMSANLDFIYSKQDNPSWYHNYEIRSHAGYICSDMIRVLDEYGSARVSGGVVLWSLDDMPGVDDLEWNLSRGRLRRQGNFDSSVLTFCFHASQKKNEEEVFDILLQSSQQQIYFFSTTYNCRPGYVPVVRNFLGNFPNLLAGCCSAQLSYISDKKLRGETLNTLLSIANNNNVAIWHWDYSANTVTPQERSQIPQGVPPELKPWCVADPEFGTPDALWRQKYEEVKQLFENNTSITRLFTDWEAQNFKG